MTGTLINTLEASGEFDVLTTLRPGEPYFVLAGRDASAPKLVQEWADARRKKILAKRDAGSIDAKAAEFELRKALEAEAIGWAMTAYRAGHKMEEAGTTTAAPAYTGHVLPEETQRRDRIQSAKIKAAAAINTAVAELAELAQMLDQGDPLIAELAGSIELMQSLSDKIKPMRPKVD